MTDTDFERMLQRTADGVEPVDLVTGAVARSRQRRRRRQIGSAATASVLVAGAITVGILVAGSGGAQRLVSTPGAGGETTTSVTPAYLPAGARLVDHSATTPPGQPLPVVSNNYVLPSASALPSDVESPTLLVGFNPNRHHLSPPTTGGGFRWTTTSIANNTAYIGRITHVEEPVTEIVWLDPAGFHGVFVKQDSALGSRPPAQQALLLRIATSLYPSVPRPSVTPTSHQPKPAVPPPVNHINLGGGDPTSQQFCAVSPATGTIRYIVQGQGARLTVSLGHVHGPSRLLGISWDDGSDHGGQVLASVRIDAAGDSVSKSVRFFHAPYRDRQGVALRLVTNNDRVIAKARAC